MALECAPDRAELTAAFYELIGFQRVEPPSTLADRALWLQAGATQIHLLYSEAPVTPPQGHVAVIADRFAETISALRSAGHEVEDRAAHWGSQRNFVRDPVGNLVEIMEFPPPAV